MRRGIRADKQKYAEDLAMTVEEATRGENMKQKHDTAKKLAEKHSKPEWLFEKKKAGQTLKFENCGRGR